MNQQNCLEEKVGELIFKEIGDRLKKATALIKAIQDGYFERYSRSGEPSKVIDEFMHNKTLTELAKDCLLDIEEILPDFCDELNRIIRTSLENSAKIALESIG